MSSQELYQQTLDRLKQLCSAAGIKLTQQRLEIFQGLLTAKDHPSAEQIHRSLRAKLPTMAIDTVYRTLATFEKLGVVKKLHIANERTLFDPNLENHHHFICSRCKRVEDFYWPDFDKADLPQAVSGLGTVQERHLEVQGICRACLNEDAGPGP
ncbi:MAG: transcriptional repressor [Thermodesulfobacteriota bacterium]